MALDRRNFLAATGATGATTATTAWSTSDAMAAPATVPISGLGVDATHLGVRPATQEDQTDVLQRAIERTAGARLPLVLMPGTYFVRELTLAPGTRLIGVPGATRIVALANAPMLASRDADNILLSGLLLEGTGKALPDGRGLVHLVRGRHVHVRDCEIKGSGQHGIALDRIEGSVTGTTVTGAAATAIFSRDARGLTIGGNTIRGAANNGIQVWRSEPGDDGTLVIDNRIEDTDAKAGGTGQNGNAINVYRAGNVTVRGNQIRRAAFSAVRGNAASNLQIVGNTCADIGEVALFVEFGFEGAVVANNLVDGAAIGISVTNFNEGGRLAVVQGNVIRNLTRPNATHSVDRTGNGISVEADTVVTGNVIENAPGFGISAGWGRYLRDVTITSNVVRGAGIGVAVSVVQGAGAAVISDNLISGTKRGAIVGMDHNRIVGELGREGTRHAQLAINGNAIR
jgi:uncharacterized secreted repeat protein (TIGR03808 family)